MKQLLIRSLDFMKKHLRTIVIIAVNALLIGFAIFFYSWQAKPIIERTENADDFTSVFLISFFILTAILMFALKRIRNYGVGFSSVIGSFLIFLFFNLNKASDKVEFIRVPQIGMLTWYDEDVRYYSTLDLGYRKLHNEVEVNRCFEFDSVDLKVINGQFGFNYFTQDTKIAHGMNCSEESSNSNTDPYFVGIELIKRRCFNRAEAHYTQLIATDSTNEEWLYYRGLIYLFTNQYELALSDFLSGATILHSQKDHSTKIVVRKIINDILVKVEERTFDKSILKDIKALEDHGESIDYVECIRFCVNKLKKV